MFINRIFLQPYLGTDPRRMELPVAAHAGREPNQTDVAALGTADQSRCNSAFQSCQTKGSHAWLEVPSNKGNHRGLPVMSKSNQEGLQVLSKSSQEGLQVLSNGGQYHRR